MGYLLILFCAVTVPMDYYSLEHLINIFFDARSAGAVFLLIHGIFFMQKRSLEYE